MEIKLTVGDASGKSVTLSLPEGKPLYGKHLGEEFKGELIDRTGYVFRITGGSDNAGFPMRTDVNGTARRKVLLAGGVGFRPKRKGIRIRKTVCGNTVGERTAQLNVRIVKAGPKPLVEAPAAAEEGEAAPADQA